MEAPPPLRELAERAPVRTWRSRPTGLAAPGGGWPQAARVSRQHPADPDSGDGFRLPASVAAADVGSLCDSPALVAGTCGRQSRLRCRRGSIVKALNTIARGSNGCSTGFRVRRRHGLASADTERAACGCERSLPAGHACGLPARIARRCDRRRAFGFGHAATRSCGCCLNQTLTNSFSTWSHRCTGVRHDWWNDLATPCPVSVVAMVRRLVLDVLVGGLTALLSLLQSRLAWG